MSLQPHQPDIIHILGEMYSQRNDWNKLQILLESADQLYTRWGNEGIHTGVTLASLFHKLGSFAYSVSNHLPVQILIDSLIIALCRVDEKLSSCGELATKEHASM